MKKLLGILVLGLLWCNVGFAEIKSYQAVQKIYPSIKAAKIMIPQLKKLIKDEVI